MSVIFNMCVKLLAWAACLILNFALYFLFGLHITHRRKNVSIPFTILTGFFLYYSLFTLFALPVMYRWRPLSLLSSLWGVFVVIVCVASLLLNRKKAGEMLRTAFGALSENRGFVLGVFLIVFVQLIVVLYSYQFTLDAAYYVANVTTSVQTNSLGIYNPYTGDWQDHFEMRYFFATYAYQDAVMCYLLKLPALIQTKVIMASVTIILTNMVYGMIGYELFAESSRDEKKRRMGLLLMLFFAGVINFFFITIYTTAAFLTTRTYEGKSILANIILPAILLIYIKLTRGERALMGYLFLISFGSTVISNTSNMLVPAALAVLFVPYVIMLLAKKEVKAAISGLFGLILCMLPGILLALTYVAYVKGKFVIYTYPR